MEDVLTALQLAFDQYRNDLEAVKRKRKPTDGLFGFGHSDGDDPCHMMFDERVGQVIGSIDPAALSSGDAAVAVRLLLTRDDTETWPLSAQWMLRAVERHALPLIPRLSPEDAAALAKSYAARYRPWDRLPVQKQVLQALREHA